MKTLITLAILLFVYPWNKTNSDKLLFEGMYTITGRGYNENQQYDSPIGCKAIYVKVYEKKLVTTVSVYGTVDFQDVEYKYEGVDKNGNRVYRKDKTEAYVVDAEQNLQWILSTFTYNGNKRTDTFWELIKGDYSADCLKRMQDELEWEQMKTTWDMSD